MEDIEYLKRQIEKEMDHLRDLYSKINRMEREQQPEQYRLERIESELKKKFPDMKVDKNLLRLVGTMSYHPPSRDKKVVRRIIAERHA